MKDLKKVKSIKELFRVIQKIEPDLHPELKKAMADYSRFEDEVGEIMDTSTKKITEISAALKQSIKRSEAALRRSRKIG